MAERWLLLHFTVPCDKRLRPYRRNGTTCELSDVARLAFDSQLEPDCPLEEHVTVLLDTAFEVQATAYYLEQDRSMTRLALERCDCIFMQAGVLWVDGAAFPAKPPEHEVRARLLRLVKQPETVTQYVPTADVHKWRRERHVLALMPRQHMRLELNFERDVAANSDLQVSVGVDDIQVAPVLSSFPGFTGAGSKRCARVHVPSAQQLADIGLQHLFLGNHSIRHDDWERVPATVSLDVRSQSVLGCSYAAQLFMMRDDCVRDESAASERPGRLEHLGCKLELLPGGMGVYDECQIELPAYLVSDRDEDTGIGIALAPLTDDLSCTLPPQSSFFVSLRPHTKLYSCSKGEFLHAEGACRNCHEYGGHDLCNPGFRLRGCPALERADRQNCVPCDEGRDLVEQRTAAYVPVANSTAPCQWKCNEGYFVLEHLGARRCIRCQEEHACVLGMQWQGCSFNQDAGCVPCEDLWLTKGPYADNEEYFNHSNTCQTQCKADHYRDRLGFCKKCWDRTELILNESPGFYTFKKCTPNRNAEAVRCVEEEGSEIVDHDPGFTGDCQRTCSKGWHKVSDKCTRCQHPPLVVDGEVMTTQFLPPDAFEWVPGSPDCAFECKLPYTDAPLSSGYTSGYNNASGYNSTGHTCVRCDVCEVGQYPYGTLCKCSTCVM